MTADTMMAQAETEAAARPAAPKICLPAQMSLEELQLILKKFDEFQSLVLFANGTGFLTRKTGCVKFYVKGGSGAGSEEDEHRDCCSSRRAVAVRP